MIGWNTAPLLNKLDGDNSIAPTPEVIVTFSSAAVIETDWGFEVVSFNILFSVNFMKLLLINASALWKKSWFLKKAEDFYKVNDISLAGVYAVFCY